MRLHKTGHEIADRVSDLIGELPDGNYNIAYGILRHNLFTGNTDPWFEVDKAFWGASHFDGNYRISFRGTQPIYSPDGPHEPCGIQLEPWRSSGAGHTLICPPSEYVCQFFGIDYAAWLARAVRDALGPYIIRNKGVSAPIKWDAIGRVVTFNSTVGIEALRRGIPVVSDLAHSTIGSYCGRIEDYSGYDREPLFNFMQAHQFKLNERGKIWALINHYLSTSDMTAERQSAPM